MFYNGFRSLQPPLQQAPTIRTTIKLPVTFSSHRPRAFIASPLSFARRQHRLASGAGGDTGWLQGGRRKIPVVRNDRVEKNKLEVVGCVGGVGGKLQLESGLCLVVTLVRGATRCVIMNDMDVKK
jgi:hypothetical protein